MTDKAFLADKLRSGKPVVTGWSVLRCPMVAEMFIHGGYEAVTVDMQHGMYDFASACEAFAAIALHGGHRIARIPVGDNALAGHLADMGAECIIAPMINSREQAEDFARSVKYPPEGERSWSPFRATMFTGQSQDEYLAKANAQIVSLAMIETREAIDALDDILSVPELDGIFIGPSDLSISLSDGKKVDPNSDATGRVAGDIAEKARKAGKLAGVFCLKPEKVKEAAGQGFHLITHGIDRSFIVDSAQAARDDIAGFIQKASGC